MTRFGFVGEIRFCYHRADRPMPETTFLAMKKSIAGIRSLTACVIVVGVTLVCCPPAQGAAFGVSKIFASNMVLQRDRPVPVWGKAAPGENVSVTFAGQTVSAAADANGDWQVELKPMPASKEDRAMTVAGESGYVEFQNVLVGDVWLCSGQSNMEMSFKWGVYDGEEFKKESVAFPQIRHVKIAKTTRLKPEPFEVPLESAWNVVSNVFDGVTATGYFFARRLARELDVPIGLVNDSWSGCKIEPFISADGFASVPGLKDYAARFEAVDPATETGRANISGVIAAVRKWADDAESALAEGIVPVYDPPVLPLPKDLAGQYNSMISPIVRFPIKGAIWYQGCSNGTEGDEYADKTEGLILGWRKAWGYDFPFYWVQLASYTASTDDPAGGNGYARIRDAQRKAMRIPGTGMAVAIDVGNPGDIHPKAKLFVGERLALWALAKDYGRNVVFSGPLVKSAVKTQAGTDAGAAAVRLDFDCVGSGLMVGRKEWNNNSPVEEDTEAAGKPAGFALCGADGKWHWADAEIAGSSVIVSSPDVSDPAAVRYAFRANPLGKCNLYNKEGLPASPFHLDVE